jgi:hypothetical protein
MAYCFNMKAVPSVQIMNGVPCLNLDADHFFFLDQSPETIEPLLANFYKFTADGEPVYVNKLFLSPDIGNKKGKAVLHFNDDILLPFGVDEDREMVRKILETPKRHVPGVPGQSHDLAKS